MNDFTKAVMIETEKYLRWTANGCYSGKWREDIARTRKRLDDAEKACEAIEAALAQPQTQPDGKVVA